VKLELGRQRATFGRAERDDLLSGLGPIGSRILERPYLACQSLGAVKIRADLNQGVTAGQAARVEVDLETGFGAHIVHLLATTLQFPQHRGFKRMPELRLAWSRKQRHQPGIDRVHLTWIDLPTTFGVGGELKTAQKEGVFEMRKVGVEGVLADGDAARLEIGVELVDAESAGGVSEQLPDHPVQDLWLAEVVAFEYVAQEQHIDIGAQKFDTVAAIESLGFRKAAMGQVIQQISGELRTLRLGEASTRFLRFSASVAQHFAKTERRNHRFHGSAAHTRGHLTREHARRRSRDEKVDVLAVQKSPGKELPTGDELNFIEEEGGTTGIAPGRVELVKRFDQ